MTVCTLESRAAREQWRALLDAAAGQTDIIITRYGKPMAAMIRYEDYVLLRKELRKLRAKQSESYQTMLASENVLHREWETPEEEAAWANL